MFHVLAEPSYSYGNFSHLLLFLNLRPPPLHPTKLILGKILSFFTYIFFSTFARPLHRSKERAQRHLTRRFFSPDRVTLLDLEKFRALL